MSLDPASDDALLKARSDALKLLSFSPRSVAELTKRLQVKRYPQDIIDRVVEQFKKQGLLDDEKFARLYASSRVHSKPVGKRQLELELKRKGLPADLVKESVEGLQDYDERAAALEIAGRRLEKMAGISTEKKKARLFGFLARRGFAQGTVYSVLEELFKDL